MGLCRVFPRSNAQRAIEALGLTRRAADIWMMVNAFSFALASSEFESCAVRAHVYSFDLGGVTVCAMGVIEEDFHAEQVVRGILDVFNERGTSSPDTYDEGSTISVVGVPQN